MEEDFEIRYLGELQRLQPTPGDVFVLSIDARLSDDQVSRLKKMWAEVMGDAKLMVLDHGIRLGCIGTGLGN